MNAETDIAVPASVANLGGGFDTLAVAVQLYLRVRIVDVRQDGEARLVVVRSVPALSGENLVERGYAAIAALVGGPAASVVAEVTSEIPLGSGLGSSAAAIVAGMRAFERVAGPVDPQLLLAAAAAVEGHGDNVAAAIHGGLVSVVDNEGTGPAAFCWRWPEPIRVVVATPGTALPTKQARAVLPDRVPRADAVFNLQRVLLFVHALQTGAYGELHEGMADRWHQPARAALVPCLAEVLQLADPAVLGACLSGAGPSVAVLARAEQASHVEGLLGTVYGRAACPVTIRTLAVHQGAIRPEGAPASAYRGTL